MNLSISEGKIFSTHDSNTVPLNASQFYENYKSSNQSLGLNVLGYGKLLFNFYLNEEKIKFNFILTTENGEFELNSLDPKQDYVIIGDNWIPLEHFELFEIDQILTKAEVDLNVVTKLGIVYEIISRCNESGLSYRFDEKIIETYKPSIPTAFAGDLALPLYPYQEYGVTWLSALLEESIGGMLCDEMGLGKTAQALGLISFALKRKNLKILIVTPSSLTINWQRELIKFIPTISSYCHVGSNRTFDPLVFNSQNLIITSYDILLRDSLLFINRDWDLIICDEAQALKNKDSRRHQLIAELKSSSKILITGTPVENSLRDIWSLSNIIKPGVLGSFRLFESLIEDHPLDAKKISKHLAPIILRRQVNDVMKDLPELIEIDEPILATDKFIDFYEKARSGEIIQTQDNHILALLTRLCQICCYPKLVDDLYKDPSDAKINRLLEILNEISLKNEKVIIFSSFKESLRLLSAIIKNQLGNPYVEIIDGSVTQAGRFQILDEFESINKFGVLCINPKAGGVGLNITSANHVIHYNRQWNPAVEKQATARSYRRGQDKPVFVHKMYYLGTVEEVINERLQSKESVAKESMSDAVSEGNQKEIQRALSISPIFTK
jgi:SNF2 family DNA or RNA helicase